MEIKILIGYGYTSLIIFIEIKKKNCIFFDIYLI